MRRTSEKARAHAAPCGVASCPAFAIPGQPMCAVHKVARKATSDGTCPRCRRHISKATDKTEATWVTTVPVAKRIKGGRTQTVYKDAHAYCPTVVPRVKKKDEPKALIDAIEALPA